MKPEKINLPKKIEPQELEQNDSELMVKIKNTITECTEDLKGVSENMQLIQQQGGWKKFWRAGSNVDNIAEHVDKITSVQEKSLDLIVMLMGASNKLKEDYDIVLESIEDLSSTNSDNPEVLDYLIKVKKTVKDMKGRDELLESLITYSNDLRDSMENVNEITVSVNEDVLETKNRLIGFTEEVDAELEQLKQKIAALEEQNTKALQQTEEREQAMSMEKETMANKLEELDEQQAVLLKFKKKIARRTQLSFVFLALLAIMFLVFLINNWST